MTNNLARVIVEVYEPEVNAWDKRGSVLLPPYAPHNDIEHALVAVGIYAPRGADQVKWFHEEFFAVIYDSEETPMVRLSKID